MRPVLFADRPRCSCGAKMKLLEYVGYYDSFKYWTCDNCDLHNKIESAKPDGTWKGQFV